jgi:hypothetical protein
MLIHFLTARTYKAHCFTFPIRVFSNILREIGIVVKFHHKLSPALGNCDVLCVGQEFFKTTFLNPIPLDRYEVLEDLRPRADAVIWFDTSAGTGKTSFSVMPYVDLYAKNQLLKDRFLYTRSFHGDEFVSDYYHSRGVENLEVDQDKRSPIRSADLKKLALSWNLGLGDFRGYYNLNLMERGFRIFFSSDRYDIRSTSPGDRNYVVDASFRGKTDYRNAATTYHRKETVRQLKRVSELAGFHIIPEGYIPYHQYINEMRGTRIVISPFGLGEICFRDFESMESGVLLFKPQIDHMETWPDYFEPGKTFVPYKWDFSDFLEKLLHLLRRPDHCAEIAREAQVRYLKSISKTGGELFCTRFYELARKAIELSTAVLD